MGSNPINGSDYNISPAVLNYQAAGAVLSGKRRTVFYFVGAESRFLAVGSDLSFKFTSPPLFYSLQWLKKISTGPSRT
jgi:hypothetical protein